MFEKIIEKLEKRNRILSERLRLSKRDSRTIRDRLQSKIHKLYKHNQELINKSYNHKLRYTNISLQEENKLLRESADHVCKVNCANCQLIYNNCNAENCVIFKLRKLLEDINVRR